MENDELNIIAGNKKLVENITDEIAGHINYLNLRYRSREDIKVFLMKDEKAKVDWVDNIEKETFPLGKKRVLDIGCGKGGIAVACAMKGAEVVGFDLDERETNIAKLRAESYSLDNILIFRGNAENIPFPDNHFDLVTAASVLEHVKNLEGVVKEMVRITKPNGYCCVTVPNPIFPREAHYKVFYIPYLPKSLGKIYLKARGFNPDFFIRYVTYPYPSVSKVAKIFRENGMDINNLTEKNILVKIKELKSTQYAKCRNIKERLLKIPIIGDFVVKLALLFDIYPSVFFLLKKSIYEYKLQ